MTTLQMIEAYRNELLLACVMADTAQHTSMHNVTTGLTAEILEQAEAHGLSPLLFELVTTQRAAVGEDGMRVLRGLALRHKRHSQTRADVLTKILHALAKNGIETLVLKGAALAHTVYAKTELRPMGDIDLLIGKRDIERAREILLGIGFSATNAPSAFVFRHHHLPALVLQADGELVIVELHHDALSGDVRESITLDDLREDPVSFSMNGVTALTLGHVDSLHHLCRHGFEPGEYVRLIHVADILRYANKYADRIDWQRIRAELPFLINTIRCLGYVTALPQPLQDIVTPPPDLRIAGVGRTFKPLSKVLTPPRQTKTAFRELFMPSAWWMHVYYNIAPESSLLRCRLLDHPAQVLRWVMRRYRNFFLSKLSAQR